MRLSGDWRYSARTSDPQLVELGARRSTMRSRGILGHDLGHVYGDRAARVSRRSSGQLRGTALARATLPSSSGTALALRRCARPGRSVIPRSRLVEAGSRVGHALGRGRRRHRPAADRDDALGCGGEIDAVRAVVSASHPGASTWCASVLVAELADGPGLRRVDERACARLCRAAPTRRARAPRRCVRRRRCAERCGDYARGCGWGRGVARTPGASTWSGRCRRPAIARARVPGRARERSLRARRATSPCDAGRT